VLKEISTASGSPLSSESLQNADQFVLTVEMGATT
jgi:hypothetical protein